MKIEHKKLGKIASAAFLVFIIGLIGSVVVGLQAFSASKSDSPYHQIIPLDRVKNLDALIEMSMGDLNVSGGSDDLMTGEFDYSKKEDQPEIDYDFKNNTGELRVTPKKSNVFWNMDWLKFGKVKNDWNIKLNDKAKLDLRVSTGVGESELDLRDLNLSGVEIDAGVGDIVLDLSGNYKHNFDVEIDSGVGEIDLVLPDDIGVRLKVDSGIGSLVTRGLNKEGNDYVNDAYNSSDTKITIDLDMGVGDVNITTKKLN